MQNNHYKPPVIIIQMNYISMLSIPYFRVVGHPNLQVGQNGRWDLASLDVSVTVWDTEKKLGMKLSSYG